MDADFPAQRIDFLIVILFEIDHAIHAEARNPVPRLGVQGDHAIARREVDDALVLAIRPIGEAAAGETPGRNFTALALVFMGPGRYSINRR